MSRSEASTTKWVDGRPKTIFTHSTILILPGKKITNKNLNVHNHEKRTLQCKFVIKYN